MSHSLAGSVLSCPYLVKWEGYNVQESTWETEKTSPCYIQRRWLEACNFEACDFEIGEGLFYLCNGNKDINQLRGFCAADPCLCTESKFSKNKP